MRSWQSGPWTARPLRVYVMGQRVADREPTTDKDLAMMRKLAAEAILVGALGFASSRLTIRPGRVIAAVACRQPAQ